MLVFILILIFCPVSLGSSVTVDINETISLGPANSDDSVTHRVYVGGEHGLAFVPNQLNANVGDLAYAKFGAVLAPQNLKKLQLLYRKPSKPPKY
ncbi:hypothetical protein VTN96DRAFT_4626 [Rasamsonia emersonii]